MLFKLKKFDASVSSVEILKILISLLLVYYRARLARKCHVLTNCTPVPIFPHLVSRPALKKLFEFDGLYYEQIDGVAMGSPLGPILANIFMWFWRKMD